MSVGTAEQETEHDGEESYLLGDSIDGLARISARQHGNNTRVHHSQPLDAIHTQRLINDASQLPRQHGARAHGVIVRRAQGARYERLEVLDRRHIRAGGILHRGVRRAERGLEVVPAPELDELDKDVALHRVAEGAVVHDGLGVPRVRGVDVDGAAVQGLHEHGARDAARGLELHAHKGAVAGAHLAG